MKEKIKEILSELEVENVDTVVDSITKEVALHTVIKAKYNELSERLKNVQTEKNTIEEELNELKEKTLTDEEKKVKEQEALDKKTKELSRELNKLKAKSVFENANIEADKIDELLEKVVSEDETKTLDLANSFAEVLKTKVDSAKQETENDLLDKTPKPNVKGQSNEPKKITKEEFINMAYSEKKKLLSTDKEQYDQLISEISATE